MLCWVLHNHGTHRQPLGLTVLLPSLMMEPAVRIKPFVPGWFPFLHSLRRTVAIMGVRRNRMQEEG